MIVLIGAEKGGTGKTTISTNLAAEVANLGKDILLVDTDKQGSASKWASVRDTYEEEANVKRVPSVQKFGRDINKDILDLANRYEYILIDAGGRDSVELRSALCVCNKVYIPLQAAQFDVWSLGEMDKIVSNAKIFNENLEAKVVINRASTNPKVQETDRVLELEEDLQYLSFSSHIIKERAAFRKAAKRGLSVCELESKDTDAKAISEIRGVLAEVFEL